MKMMYGNVPIKSLNVKHYELDSNSCDMVASDLQAGKTAVAKGRKITGTGKSFEFAQYGNMRTNLPMYVPTTINAITISSLDYPVKTTMSFSDVRNVDFLTEQTIGQITIDGVDCPINIKVENSLLTIVCSNTIWLQVFFGKDNYV